ncbi:MAG: hypothetical protein WBC95_16665, partial [Albidovulum sp.]
QPERMQLVRKAAYTIAGRADQAALPEAAPATLPLFAVPAAPVEGQSADAETVQTTVAFSSEQVESLPLIAQLPFLLFKN